jgi:hypothetical protein
MRLEGNVFQQHQFVITAHFLELAGQVDGGIIAVSLAVFLPRPRDALGGIEQALARRIIA